MRFKLLAGKHIDENRATYSKGEVVETELDLVKVFGANKFKRLSDAAPAPEPDDGEIPLSASRPVKVGNKPLTKTEKQMARKKLQSNEQGPGEEVEEDETQGEGAAAEEGEAPEGDEERVAGAGDDAADDGDTEDRGELGNDVTADFEDFKAAKLKVWRDGNQFNVTTRKDQEKALNKTVLKKIELKKFLKTHLKEKEGQ